MKNVTNMDRDCVLIFDELALKTNFVYNKANDCLDGFEDFDNLGRTKLQADHALVFMLRGVARKWKQPLGYFLVSGSVKPQMLQNLVHSCLSKLELSNLHVVSLICDQGPTNRSFLEKLENVSVQQPFILHSNRPIFVIYDPPHLLKNIRNNLKKHGFVYNGKLILWKHIEQFHNFDKTLSIRMAPRLTDKHLNLPPFTSMRVPLAAQVLSHSVAAGINTLSILGKLDSDATNTAEFIEKIDQLFNACNSSKIKSTQNMGHAVTARTEHVQFFKSMIDYFSSLKLPHSNIKLPCINGWRITLSAILRIWEQLHHNGYNFLLTRRLNQDCIENLFSVIRGMGGHRDNPDVQQFNWAFRHVIVDGLFAPNIGSNCEVDYDEILLDIQSILKPKNSKSEINPPIALSKIHIDVDTSHCELEMSVEDCVPSCVASDVSMGLELIVESDGNSRSTKSGPLTLEVENVAAYMAGYLLRKGGFLQPDACNECLKLFSMPVADRHSQKSVFLRCKENKENCCLLYPTPLFQDFIASLEQYFNGNIDLVLHERSEIILKMSSNAASTLHLPNCGKFKCAELIKYMIKLYITVRLHFKIKCMNRETVLKQATKRNRKASKVLHL
jgi:hypothetical protein